MGGYSRRHRGRGHGVQRSHDRSREMPGATWAGPRTESTTLLENEGSFVLLEHKHYRVGETGVVAMGQAMNHLSCLFFSHSFSKYLLNNDCVPGPVLGTAFSRKQETKSTALMELRC